MNDIDETVRFDNTPSPPLAVRWTERATPVALGVAVAAAIAFVMATLSLNGGGFWQRLTHLTITDETLVSALIIATSAITAFSAFFVFSILFLFRRYISNSSYHFSRNLEFLTSAGPVPLIDVREMVHYRKVTGELLQTVIALRRHLDVLIVATDEALAGCEAADNGSADSELRTKTALDELNRLQKSVRT